MDLPTEPLPAKNKPQSLLPRKQPTTIPSITRLKQTNQHGSPIRKPRKAV